MGKYIDLLMMDCAKLGLTICKKLDKLSHKIMAWSYDTEHKIYMKYGQDLKELF